MTARWADLTKNKDDPPADTRTEDEVVDFVLDRLKNVGG